MDTLGGRDEMRGLEGANRFTLFARIFTGSFLVSVCFLFAVLFVLFVFGPVLLSKPVNDSCK